MLGAFSKIALALYTIAAASAAYAQQDGVKLQPYETLFDTDETIERELPEALKRLHEASAVLLSDQEEGDGPLKLSEISIEELEKPDVIFKYPGFAKLISKTLLFGHTRSLHKTLKGIVERLAVPGDPKQFEFYVSASPLPNAAVEVAMKEGRVQVGRGKPVRMFITAALLAFCRSEDHLAAVIAHEMTHANPKYLEASYDSAEAEKLLNSISGYSDLSPAQREEIRADMGALSRMIRAGYNPWAQYEFEKWVARFYARHWDIKLQKRIWKLFFRRSLTYLEAHPLPEVRMAATKAWILNETRRIDLSEHTAKNTKFPVGLRFLQKRMALYSLPFTSVWANRAIYVYLAYQALALTGAMDTEAARQISQAADGAKETIGTAVGPTLEATKHALKPLLDPAKEFFQDNPPETIASWTGKTILRLWQLYSLYVLRESITSTFRAPDYASLRKSESEYSAYMKQLRDKRRLSPREVRRLLASNQNALLSVDRLFRTKDMGMNPVRILRSINLLSIYTGMVLRDHRDVLTLAVEQSAKWTGAERRQFWKSVRPLLDKLPPFVFENRRVALTAKELIAKFDKPEARRSQESLQRGEGEGMFAYQTRLSSLGHELNTKVTPPDRVTSLITNLQAVEIYDLASRLLRRDFRRILSFAFSSENTDSRLAPALARAVMIAAENRSLDRTPLLQYPSDIGRFNLKTLPRFLGRPLKTALTESFSREVGLFLPTYLNLRFWLTKGISRYLELFFENSFTSVEQLATFVKNELNGRNAITDNLTPELFSVILKHPEWVRSSSDLKYLLEIDAFWPKVDVSRAGPLERSMVELLKRRQNELPAVWKYEPGSTERLHAIYLNGLAQLGQTPRTQVDQFYLWLALTERGVSTHTDTLFQKLYSSASGDLKENLEQHALSGRVWDPTIRDTIIKRQMDASETLHKLATETNPANRLALLHALIKEIQAKFRERGPTYTDLLEKVSIRIESSDEESQIIENAKVPASGIRQEDLGLRIMSDVLDGALNWRKTHQWDLVLFLRGDGESTEKINKAFRVFGPERIRRIFQMMPLAARTTVLDSFLASPRGLLPSVSLSSGYASTIISHLLSGADPTSSTVAHEVLDGFLHSLKATGNTPLQSFVIAYLLGRTGAKENRPGRVLKEVLEVFGTTGVKIGQFLAASEILSQEDTAILKELQEHANTPTRNSIYDDISEITDGRLLPLKIKALLGSASMKYAVLAEDSTTQTPIVLKILRLEALAHTRTEFKQLEAMADYLSKTYGKKYGIFRSIVRASKSAVERELSFKGEERNSSSAATKIYAGQSDSDFLVEVPREVRIGRRLIASEFAPGTSFNDLPNHYKSIVAEKILAMELSNLFSDSKEIFFDPDRHAGNYRIEASEDGEGGLRIRISPIDFGQVQKLSSAVRETILDLFAISQVVARSGATDFIAKRIATLVQLDESATTDLARKLKLHFPAQNASPVSNYYSVLSALEESGRPMESVFFDFIRSIVQLKQYEAFASEDFSQRPGTVLEKAVRSRAETFGEEVRANLRLQEKARMAFNRSEKSDGGRRGARPRLASTISNATGALANASTSAIRRPVKGAVEFWGHYGRFATVLGAYEGLNLIRLYLSGRIEKSDIAPELTKMLVSPQAVGQYFAFQKIDGFSSSMIEKTLSEFNGAGKAMVLAKTIFRQTFAMAIASGTLEYGIHVYQRASDTVDYSNGFDQEDMRAIAQALQDAAGDINLLSIGLRSIGFSVGTALGTMIPIVGQNFIIPLIIGFAVSDVFAKLEAPIRGGLASLELSVAIGLAENQLLVLGLHSEATETPTPNPRDIREVTEKLHRLQAAFQSRREPIEQSLQQALWELSQLAEGRISAALTRKIDLSPSASMITIWGALQRYSVFPQDAAYRERAREVTRVEEHIHDLRSRATSLRQDLEGKVREEVEVYTRLLREGPALADRFREAEEDSFNHLPTFLEASLDFLDPGTHGNLRRACRNETPLEVCTSISEGISKALLSKHFALETERFITQDVTKQANDVLTILREDSRGTKLLVRDFDLRVLKAADLEVKLRLAENKENSPQSELKMLPAHRVQTAPDSQPQLATAAFPIPGDRSSSKASDIRLRLEALQKTLQAENQVIQILLRQRRAGEEPLGSGFFTSVTTEASAN